MKYIFILFSIICLSANSQDFTFTNSNQSLVALNPSFAGSNGNLRYQAIYRAESYNLSTSYLTYYNSIDVYLKPLRAGLALAYSHDDQVRGTLKTDRIDLTYAQHFSFMDDKLKIIPSVQIGFFQKILDRSKLTFGDPIDPRAGFTWYNPGFTPQYSIPYQRYYSKSNIDFSSGLIVNYKKFYVGASVFHFTQPEEGFFATSKLPYRLSIFVSYNLYLGDNVLLNFMSRLESQQNFYVHRLNVDALFKKHFVVGLGLLSNNTITTKLGYRHHYFTITAGYDFGTFSNLSNSAGSAELTASFTLRKKDEHKLVKDFERW